ncbi:hypothetical protein [Pseudorhodoplanes sp.]|uniref:hypothetical protein n=1 Tax=Pseudorhodoplanes sp. TaxID=1934341 RepID=UPI002C998860|nr:hypothetical protein [Pseudorhodoplanes sp.]HWV54651.1 hypothetical protein [Pseudorhodoplanes sp.]
MAKKGDLQDELEKLRRELRQVPRVAEDNDAATAAAAQAKAAPPPPDDARGEIERVLSDLQDRLGEAADEAEDIVAAHPFASVAAAFLLGVLVANLMSRAR